MATIEEWLVVSTGDGLGLARRGYPIRLIAGSSTFTVGVTDADDVNTGAGTARPYPTIVIEGNVSVTDGQTLVDRIVNGRITISGTGRVDNCVVRGTVAEPTAATSLINASGATPSPLGVPNIQFTTVEPQTPSAWWSGIGNKNYNAYRVKVRKCVDGFSAFSVTADGLCNVKARGCYVDQLMHFAPDYANANRTRTHNDCIQMQRNLGDAGDILIEGCTFIARHHLTLGTQPEVYSELACVMVSPNDIGPAGSATRVSYTSRRNRYYGGVFTVNAGATNTGGVIIHDGDRFERPGVTTPGPTSSLVIDAGTTRTVTNCTYLDTGAQVPITNG